MNKEVSVEVRVKVREVGVRVRVKSLPHPLRSCCGVPLTHHVL